MTDHQLSAIVLSTAAAVAIAVLAGAPFLRMVPLLLILGGPLVALLALRVTGAFEERPDQGGPVEQRAPRSSQLPRR